MASKVESYSDLGDLTEFDIIQNYVLCAHALREFVKLYQENSDNHSGPVLLLTMPILPLVLNKDTSDSISKRYYADGSLIKTLMEDRTLYVGLQRRMERMWDQSMKSLSMAFYLGFLTYDAETSRLAVNNTSEPGQGLGKDYRDILNTSRRLGKWFARYSSEELLRVFEINF